MNANKSFLGKLYYIAICYMEQYKIKYEQAKEFINSLINKDFSIIKKLPSDDLIEICKELQKYNVEISDKEKQIYTNTLVKTVYSLANCISKANDKKLSYVERERQNYQAIVLDIKIELLLTYITEGKNLINEFERFKIDIKNYASNLGIISQLADSKDEGLKICIEERKKDAKKLINKYKYIFNISECLLRTTFEKDLLEKKYTKKLNKSELALVF